MTLAERYEGVLAWFEATNPDAATELHFANPWQLLVAVVLSAQCTDKRVNMVTPTLFEAFPTPEKMAAAEPDEIRRFIASVSYPNAKANHLHRAAKMLVEEFGSEVPADIDSLVKLPGVGRKTANVMLSVVWNKAAMPVDTHVFRVSNRIGLTRNSKTPLATEKALMKHIPEHLVAKAHHWLILHGRYVCKARKPLCGECGLTGYCRHFSSEQKKR